MSICTKVYQDNCYGLRGAGIHSLITHDETCWHVIKTKGVREFLLPSIKSIFLAKEETCFIS